jgi:hypothetical protein
MIEKLTDAVASIEGDNMRGVTCVEISQVASGEWSIGAQPVTSEAVKAPRGRVKGSVRPVRSLASPCRLPTHL